MWERGGGAAAQDVSGGGSVSVLYGGLVSGYTARLTWYLSRAGVLTMGREVWVLVSDFVIEEWGV